MKFFPCIRVSWYNVALWNRPFSLSIGEKADKYGSLGIPHSYHPEKGYWKASSIEFLVTATSPVTKHIQWNSEPKMGKKNLKGFHIFCPTTVVFIQLMLYLLLVNWKHSWLPFKINQMAAFHILHAFELAGKIVSFKGCLKPVGEHLLKTYVKLYHKSYKESCWKDTVIWLISFLL